MTATAATAATTRPPTFMIDGLVVADMGSGETVEAWLERLGMA